MSSGGNGPPPGLETATLMLAVLATILSLPFADQMTHQFIYDLAAQSYGERWASLVRWVWFAALGLLILATARLTIWTAAFGAVTGGLAKYGDALPLPL